MIADNEIYPENSSLAINNYALGYQDFFGFSDRSTKDKPLAPENERYMCGWFAARMSEIEKKCSERVNPIYAGNRAVRRQAEALQKEWELLASSHGWRKEFPL